MSRNGGKRIQKTITNSITKQMITNNKQNGNSEQSRQRGQINESQSERRGGGDAGPEKRKE